MNQVLVEICLRIKDLDATLDFYTNLFDFEVASHRKFPEEIGRASCRERV